MMELTKEIYEKYPKVWGKIKTYLEYEKSCVIYNDNSIRYKDVGLDEMSMLYALLEDFFEENGIIIEITVQDKDFFTYELRDDEGNGYSIGVFIRTCDTKNKAKSQAILKACEILEEK